MVLESNAPLVVFVYNRAEHTKKLLASVNSAKGADCTDLYIFSDGAKSSESEKDVAEVRNVINNFIENESRFKKIELIRSTENCGLANSIINGVTKIIKQYGKIIVLEDDLEVSVDFLEYMNGGLNYYKDNQSIWSISGYTLPLKSLENYRHDIYVALRGCSWGWATWLDRWEKVDWEVKNYNTIKFNLKKRLDFGRWGRDMPFMLDANVYGMNHSWAIRWCYSSFQYKQYTVYPKESRVINKGTDGSGTNYTSTTDRYDSVLSDGSKKVKFESVMPDKQIEKEFRWKMKRKLGFIRDCAKWFVIKATKKESMISEP